jgi:acetyl esterase/lipase
LVRNIVLAIAKMFLNLYFANILTPLNPLQILLTTLPLILTIVVLFLSIWSVIPAPNMTLLPLSVGAPELSIWLLGGSAIGLASQIIFRSQLFPKTLYWVGIGLSILSMVLNAHPFLQMPATIDQANTAMNKALGNNYLAEIPSAVQATWRSQPFSFLTALQGIKQSSPIRIQRHLPFAASAGTPLTLNVYQPQLPGKYPAVIQIYGGAWRHGSPDNNEEFSRYLASRGYVVVSIDYRHAPQHHFPAQLIDIRTALECVQQQATNWEIDLDRLAITGRSAGGHLATLIALQPDILPLKAVVSYYGPVDLIAGYNDPPKPDPIDSRQVLRDFLGGTPTEFPEQYRQASPYQGVDTSKQVLPPTLLIYGGQDHLVEVRFGQKMARKLQSVGTSTVYIEIPWANHAFDAIFSGPSNQLALYYTERFLAHSLQLEAKIGMERNTHTTSHL